MKKFNFIITAILSLSMLTACSDNTNAVQNSETSVEVTTTNQTETEIILETTTNNTEQSELEDTITTLDNAENDYFENEIVFPAGNDEVTEYNSDILSIDTFSVSFLLPTDWKIDSNKPEGNEFVYNPVFSMQYIFNESNTCVGAVGYNVIPELSEEEMIPAAIYSQIGLGNDYRFDIREKYEIVENSDTFETALTDVYYSDSFNDTNGEKINKGIVVYDTSKGIYIAFEFNKDALTEEQYTEIAKSIDIT